MPLVRKPDQVLKLLPGLVFLFLTPIAWSQTGSPYVQQLNALKDRTLIVMMEQENPKLVNRMFKRPEQLALYKAEIARINTALRQAATYWVLNKEIQFKTPGEVKTLRSQKTKDYVLLYLDRDPWYYRFRNTRRYMTSNDTTYKPKNSLPFWVKHERYLNRINDASALILTRLEEQNSPRMLNYIALPSVFPTPGDLVFAVRSMEEEVLNQYQFRSSDSTTEKNKAPHKLIAKILLLDKMEIEEGVSAITVERSFPYPFQITDYSTIERAIIEKDKRYTYCILIPEYNSGRTHRYSSHSAYIVDAETAITIKFCRRYYSGRWINEKLLKCIAEGGTINRIEE